MSPKGNSVKTSGGASATIYGVPVSGSYGSFKDSVRKKATSLGYSNFEYQSVSIATTTLTDKNLAAYKDCVSTASPVSIVNEGGLATAYRLSIRYSPAIGTTPVRGEVLQSLNLLDDDVKALNTRLAGLVPGPFLENRVLRPSDSAKEAALSIGTQYYSTSIVLVPLTPPQPPPPPPPKALIDLDKVHGGAEVNLTINSACQNVGSLACGQVYSGRRATSSNKWTFYGYNSARGKNVDQTYAAENQPGHLSLWGINLTYDDQGVVYRAGAPFGRIAYKN